MCEILQIPKEEEIAELPVLAMVAFAARCARRVQPLFGASWTDAPKEHTQAIEDAIALAEETAKSAQRHGQKGTDAVIKADEAAEGTAEAGYDVAAYVAYSAKHALQAATSFPLIAAEYVAKEASVATNAADKAAKNYPSTDSTYKVFIKAVCSDFKNLKAKTQGKGELFNPPIPPDFFGRLWLEEKPDGWPT